LLLRLALTDGDAQFGAHFVALARNSFLLAGVTAIMCRHALALLLAYGARLSNGLLAPDSIVWSAWATRFPGR
jgi:iron(III) transport system permease protein